MAEPDQILHTTDNAPLPPLPTDALVVIKIGSAVLTGPDGGLDRENLRMLCADMAWLQNTGRRVLVVTSGAVAAGRSVLHFPISQKLTIAEKQACAAAGQARLMQAYADELAPFGISVAQLLLSRGDMDDRRRYINVRHCLHELLSRRILPLINENDTTTVDELRFGDNDGLASIVAVSTQATQLWILSDVAGLYDSNPKINPNARLIHHLPQLNDDIEARFCSQTTPPGVGSGGMASKLRAARMATQGGVITAIAHGRTPGQIHCLASGICNGTWFSTTGSTVTGRRSWIAAATPSGRLMVDDGARHALEAGKRSLLPAGIRQITGEFEAGDIVEVAGPDNRVFAKGSTNYPSDELALIMGRRSDEIEAILGTCPYHEAIHRDNLVVTNNRPNGTTGTSTQ
jgi:glutamate 5-kinase